MVGFVNDALSAVQLITFPGFSHNTTGYMLTNQSTMQADIVVNFKRGGCDSLFLCNRIINLLALLLKFGFDLATAPHTESDWLSQESVLYTSIGRLLLELMGQSRLCARPRVTQIHMILLMSAS